MAAGVTKPDTVARRVAVLGGTGWLGRHVRAAASRRGHDVVTVARHHVPHVTDHSFVPLDLATAPTGTLTDLLYDERVGTVVNATDAANARDGWARSDEDFALLNTDLVHRLVAAVSSLPWRVRIVHIGTLHEYGEVPFGTVIDEARTPFPGTAYTRSKLAGSKALLGAVRTGAVEGLVLRAANITGPHPSPESFPGKLVAMLRRAVETGRPMSVALAGTRRDFVDVRDVAEAVMLAGAAPANGRVFNIGSGEAVDMETLVRLFITAAGNPAELVVEEAREVPTLGGSWTCADIRLAQRLLGWSPRVSLVESLRAMWSAAA